MCSSIDDLYEHPSGGGPLNYNVTKNWYASKKHFNRAPDAFIDIFSSKHHFNPYKKPVPYATQNRYASKKQFNRVPKRF